MGLSVAGYAALFHVEDRGGDVILPGAFAATLRGNQPLPLLLQHRPDRRIGTARAVEDRRGLRMIGEIEDGEAAALVAADAVTGLSFGYRVRSAEGGRPRRIAALDLVELSLVAIPMQPAARVYAAAHRPSRPKTRKESEWG